MSFLDIGLTSHTRFENAEVEIPITLGTSPEQLDDASDEPFRVVVTAHNRGDRPITFWPLLTPFMSLRWGSFENIECLSSQESRIIEIYPIDWPHWVWNSEDLERDGFITIPAAGSVSIKHEVPRDAITATGVKPGERYRVRLTYQRTVGHGNNLTCMLRRKQGCKWWSHGTLDDLKDLRLRTWRTLPEFPDVPEGEEDLMAKEWRETYGTGPWTFGERPGHLCFLGQNVAEFEVAGAVETSMSALSLATKA